MGYSELRKELYEYYLNGDSERAKNFANKCFELLNKKVNDGMSVARQKTLQYEVITEEFEPKLFKNSPFYYETGVLVSLSDGARYAKGHNFVQANGWVFERNAHKFKEFDKELYNRRMVQGEEMLYLICGAYNDDCQHFNLNLRPILENGLKGLYEKAQNELKNAKDNDETDFLNAICFGMLQMKKCGEKFAEKADEMLYSETDAYAIENLRLISKTARRVPWEKPQTFYEALETLAFMRTVFGSLEGVGPNTFGRIDSDLIPFYKHDIDNGLITENEAYDLICKFLITWDCHYDHDMIMSGYADHEFENTYTIGGCDANGNAVYNEITKILLNATYNEHIIFPKIKARFSSSSPKEYLSDICKETIQGTSTILYSNDEAVIASLLRAGRPLNEARDYIISGCWGVVTNFEKYDHGSYFNLLKPFEFALHNLKDKINKVKIPFKVFNGSESFEEIYKTVLYNTELLLKERISITQKGGMLLPSVDICPIFSATIDGCIENHKDYSQNGAKYRDDYMLMFGLPNIVDSLLAIKELCFERKKYTFKQMLEAIKANWNGCEEMRNDAIRCNGFGDGSEISCSLATRFNNDLYKICSETKGSYGGRVHMGHLTYTEIRFWGEKTLATPDGRFNGDYFAQGLTPSRLKKIPFSTDVIHTLSQLDKSTMAANSVVNLILPSDKITPDLCSSFLVASAHSALQSLQLNCTTRQQLLDAQKHPEKYPNLIVRVTGFSAKFTALSKEWQDEILSRNFYEG